MAKKTIPKNNNLERVYSMHLRHLSTLAARVFKWQNLPQTLPQYEIESRLFRQGFAVVFRHPKFGIVTSDGAICGVNIYNRAESFNYSQPKLGSGNGRLGVSGVCVYNTSVDSEIVSGAGGSVMRDLLEWYARALTDVDISITLLTIKARNTNGIIANNDLAKRAIDEYFDRLEQGEIKVPFAPANMFDNVTDLVQRQAVSATSVPDLMQLKSNLMRDFYATFGIQSIQHKNERLITDEITNDTDFLRADIADMLSCRQAAAAQINEIFGLNIFVEVNDYVS